MAQSDVPNRCKAMIIGMVAGVFATAARRAYERSLAPRLFPEAQPPAFIDSTTDDPVERMAIVAPQYRPEETTYNTLARVIHSRLAGREAESEETRELLKTLGDYGAGMLVGAAYGYSRTTTRSRDVAGAFFMGIRLWLAEIFAAPLLGLRAGPTRYSIDQHARLLSTIWAFTFVMTTLTRVVYKVLSPRHW